MPVTTITRKLEWDMGHRIPNHESLCRNPHGHRYVVELTVEGPIIDKDRDPEQGMVRDFSGLKDFLSFIPRQWDHAFMVYSGDPFAGALAQFARNTQDIRIVEVQFIPTAENIAAEIFRLVNRNCALTIVGVTVWETPNCKATVRRN